MRKLIYAICRNILWVLHNIVAYWQEWDLKVEAKLYQERKTWQLVAVILLGRFILGSVYVIAYFFKTVNDMFGIRDHK